MCNYWWLTISPPTNTCGCTHHKTDIYLSVHWTRTNINRSWYCWTYISDTTSRPVHDPCSLCGHVSHALVRPRYPESLFVLTNLNYIDPLRYGGNNLFVPANKEEEVSVWAFTFPLRSWVHYLVLGGFTAPSCWGYGKQTCPSQSDTRVRYTQVIFVSQDSLGCQFCFYFYIGSSMPISGRTPWCQQQQYSTWWAWHVPGRVITRLSLTCLRGVCASAPRWALSWFAN